MRKPQFGPVLGSFLFSLISLASPEKIQGQTATVVQHTGKDCSGIVAPCTIPFSSATVSGNTLMVLVRAGGASPSVGVSDSTGDVYALAGSCPQPSDPHKDFLLYAVAKGGASTVTVTMTSGTTVRVSILEASGLVKFDSLGCSAGSGTTPSLPVSSAAAGDFMLAAVSTANSDSYTFPTGMTPLDTVAKITSGWRIGIPSTMPTLSSSDLWASLLAGFVPIVASPPPPPPPPPISSPSFSCTPSFLPVQFSTFVPSGAKGVTFSILNPSTNPLIISQVTPPKGFTIDPSPALPVTIASGDSQAFTIRFVPTGRGTYAGNVVFLANVANGNFLMGVSGTAQ